MSEAQPNNPVDDPAAAGAPPLSDDPVSPEAGDGAEDGAPPSVDSAPADGGGATIADDTGDDKPAAAPATWPDDWREQMAGGDAKALGVLKRYTAPGNVLKALIAAQTKIRAGELAPAKPEGDDEKALAEWRKAVGIPETPEGYLENMPEGLVVGEGDEELVGSFVQDMHAADMPPDAVHKALGWYYGNEEKLAAARLEADRAAKAQNEDTLRAEWGNEYRANLNGLHNLLDTYGEEGLKEKLFGARLADGSPLGDDPDTLRFLVGLSRELNPAGTVTPRTGETQLQTIQAEKQQLEIEMADTRARQPGGYWSNPAKQDRYRELLEAEEKLQRRSA